MVTSPDGGLEKLMFAKMLLIIKPRFSFGTKNLNFHFGTEKSEMYITSAP